MDVRHSESRCLPEISRSRSGREMSDRTYQECLRADFDDDLLPRPINTIESILQNHLVPAALLILGPVCTLALVFALCAMLFR